MFPKDNTVNSNIRFTDCNFMSLVNIMHNKNIKNSRKLKFRVNKQLINYQQIFFNSFDNGFTESLTLLYAVSLLLFFLINIKDSTKHLTCSMLIHTLMFFTFNEHTKLRQLATKTNARLEFKNIKFVVSKSFGLILNI